MSYTLGVDLGTTFTAAAIARGDHREVLNLGMRSSAIPSVLFVDDEGAMLVGDPAQRRGEHDPLRMARHFKRRLGDSAPILIGSTPYHADRLMGRLLASVIASATEREGERPARIVVTHPANWGPYKKELLEQAIQYAGADGAEVLTEPEAAAIHYSLNDRMPVGDIVAVYDLGGGTFDASILRKTSTGFEVLGEPQGIERLGGIDFDEALVDKVLHDAGVSRESLDDSAETVSESARLRHECTAAKEALSEDTQVAIPVQIGGLDRRITVTRTEFEELIRPLVDDTIRALDRSIRQAGLVPDQLRSILLVGGSSRIPLIGRLITEAFQRPFAVDVDPKLSVALGAVALSAASSDRSAPVAPAPPPLRPAPPPPEPVTPIRPPPPGGRASPIRLLPVGIVVAVVTALVVAIVVLGGDADSNPTAVSVAEPPTTDPEPAPTTTTTTTVATTTTTSPLVIGPIAPAQVTASSTAAAGVEANGTPVTYDAANTVDGEPSTTWRTPGDGVGQTLVVDLGRAVDITLVGLLPGYGKIDPTDGTDRFNENRRIRSVRWIFEDGTSTVQTFDDQPIVQTIPVATRSRSIVIEILETTAPGGRDFAAISEIDISGEQ